MQTETINGNIGKLNIKNKNSDLPRRITKRVKRKTTERDKLHATHMTYGQNIKNPIKQWIWPTIQ